jgi:hypothetical protein
VRDISVTSYNILLVSQPFEMLQHCGFLSQRPRSAYLYNFRAMLAVSHPTK